MKTVFHISIYQLIFILFIYSSSVTGQNLEHEINGYLSAKFDTAKPGLSILVAKDGKAIYAKGFGMANMELDVKVEPKHVFEIGSITKQFTAVSILMLKEQGKLSLDDEITKYIPDYPTQGKTITIHNLLNHTSGIKSYTNLPSFMELARTDMTPLELIDKFKNEPMEFDPGTKFNYNNSGYIILGYIIEKITEMSYAQFIEKEIFETLNMTDSYYGSMVDIIPNRASGYSQTQSGYRNADYLSLTLPYAAGSIMTTTSDLLKWQNAISENTLISESSLKMATNGSTLNNGESIPYGYGWIKTNLAGSRTYEHGGGIFGYTSNGIYLPTENIYVIGLTNCDCGDVNGLVRTVAAMAMGKPFPTISDAIRLSESEMKRWVGAYQFDEGVVRHVTLSENQLYSQREGSTKLKIFPLSKTRFFFGGTDTYYEFYNNDKGERMAKFTASGEAIEGRETDKSPPAEKVSVELSEDVLKDYVGKYELQPNFHIDIRLKDVGVFAQATGQPEFQIFASEKDKFYLKVVPAEIMFNRNSKNEVESLTLFQNGQEMPGKKIN